MAGKLSPKAQVKLAALQSMKDKVHHVHGLVERYAATTNQQRAERMAHPMMRAFGKLKLELLGAGFDTMSQLAGAMEMAARRGGSQRTKARILREGVGSLRNQFDQEQKRILAEEQREQRKAEAEEKDARLQADEDQD